MAEESLSNLETFFMALADKTRLRLLNLIQNQEICVNSLVAVLNESQPKVSRHLAYLRNAGLVETKREGKQINYYIAESEDLIINKTFENILRNLNFNEQLKSDLERLEEINHSNSKQNHNTYAQTDINYSRPGRVELETFLL